MQVTSDLLNSESQSGYSSAIQWAAGLQCYYVIVDPNIGE